MVATAIYQIDGTAPLYRQLEDLLRQQQDVATLRWAIVAREFPDVKTSRDGYQIMNAPLNETEWGVRPPDGATIPEDWEFQRDSDILRPTRTTKRGKRLDKELRDAKYRMPGLPTLARLLGISWQPHMMAALMRSPSWLSLFTTTTGHLMLLLPEQWEAPAGCLRVSHEEALQLGAAATELTLT